MVISGTVSGGITNIGTISPHGIIVDSVHSFPAAPSSTAAVVSFPAASGSILRPRSSIRRPVPTAAAIFLRNGTFAGGITNSGTLSGHGNGVLVLDVSGGFSGGIVNAGGGLFIAASHSAIAVKSTSTFAGNIVNGGTDSSTNEGDAIFVSGVSVFAGTLDNVGSVGVLSGTGIGIYDITTLTGGIVNHGTISAGRDLLVAGVSILSGGVVNTGRLSANNNAAIKFGTASTAGVATLAGGIVNSGTISASDQGILVRAPALFQAESSMPAAAKSIRPIPATSRSITRRPSPAA